jgi:3-oxosteroid 1-dehydrogenase
MNETFDFVVIGSGGGSMCAALVMRAMGKSVVILEKTDLVGGTTAKSGGVMWIPNNRFMKRDGVEDSPEKANAYLDAIIGEDPEARGATPARRRAYVAEAPKMLEFLIEQGLKFRRIKLWPDYYDDEPGGSVPGRTVVADLFDLNELGEWREKLRPTVIPVPAYMDEIMKVPLMSRSLDARMAFFKIAARVIWTKLTGKRLATGGNALQGRMLQAAVKAGVHIRVNSPVKQILVENGRATGVVTMQDGRDWQIGARLGVLINAGGFSRSQRLREKYIPGTSVEWTNTAPGDTGEMIEEAVRIGAAVAQMETTVGGQIALPPGVGEFKPLVQGEGTKPHAIVVDQSGVRYMNEAGSYVDFCYGMIARHKTTPAIPSWLVVDGQFISKYGLVGTNGPDKPEAWYQSGFLRRGQTLEELAAASGMDSGKLKASVERFNGFVQKGRDEDFRRGARAYERWQGDPTNRPSPSLGTIEQGPFFAVQVFPGDVSTYGGVVTDEYARVLRSDGSLIDGLYATGTSTASAMGRREPAAGGSVGPSFLWGYVAARHAANAGNQAELPSKPQQQVFSSGAAQSAS